MPVVAAELARAERLGAEVAHGLPGEGGAVELQSPSGVAITVAPDLAAPLGRAWAAGALGRAWAAGARLGRWERAQSEKKRVGRVVSAR